MLPKKRLKATVGRSGSETTFHFRNHQSSVVLDGRPAKLVQIHAHAGSEHDIEGHPAGLKEFHLVHEFTDGLDPSDFSTHLVLAVHVREDNDAEACTVPRAEGIDIAVASLLPRRKRVFRYEGSLTSKGAAGTVSWVVFADIVTAQHGDFERLRCDANHHEAKPEPLARRFVLRSFKWRRKGEGSASVRR